MRCRCCPATGPFILQFCMHRDCCGALWPNRALLHLVVDCIAVAKQGMFALRSAMAMAPATAIVSVKFEDSLAMTCEWV